MLGLHCRVDFSLVAESGGYSLVAVRGLLTVATSLVAEHRFWGMQASVVVASGLQSTGSVVVMLGLVALWHVGWNPRLLHWQVNSLPLSLKGSPGDSFLHLSLFCKPAFPGRSVGKKSTCSAGDPSLIPELGRFLWRRDKLQCSWASLVAQTVKNLPAMWETWV